MPIVYEYLGMLLGIYTDDHEPIHFHANYNGNVLKIVLYVKNGCVYRVGYFPVVGRFPPSKIKQLKKFVSKYKQAMLFAWEQVSNGVQIKRVVITKKV